MANLNKEQQFKNLIWESFHTAEKFDKINYVFNKIRKTFIEDITDFNKLKVETQFSICNTSYHISLNSKRSIAKEISLRTETIDAEIIKYDPEYNFKEPDYVTIKLPSGKIVQIESI